MIEHITIHVPPGTSSERAEDELVDQMGHQLLDGLRAKGYAIVKVGEVPPWMVEFKGEGKYPTGLYYVTSGPERGR